VFTNLLALLTNLWYHSLVGLKCLPIHHINHWYAWNYSPIHCIIHQLGSNWWKYGVVPNKWKTTITKSTAKYKKDGTWPEYRVPIVIHM